MKRIRLPRNRQSNRLRIEFHLVGGGSFTREVTVSGEFIETEDNVRGLSIAELPDENTGFAMKLTQYVDVKLVHE